MICQVAETDQKLGEMKTNQDKELEFIKEFKKARGSKVRRILYAIFIRVPLIILMSIKKIF